MIYIALAMSVFHGWITGVLVTSFSSVFRAVADGFPILIIYFLLDPLSSRLPLASFQSAYTQTVPWPPPDWARDAMCLILPLSSTTFSRAAEELRKAVDDTLVQGESSDKSCVAENSRARLDEEDEEDDEDDGNGENDEDSEDPDSGKE